MRIAMFSDTYTPQVNGVVTSIQSFREELEKRGHEVSIFAPAARHAPEEENVYRIRSFSFAPYPGYRISVPNPTIISKFEDAHADIIHVHTPVSMGAIGIGLSRHFGLPTVGTFHTLLPEYLHYIVKGNMQKFLMRPARSLAWNWCAWFYNRCDAVIAPSEPIAKMLKENGIEKPVHVLPTGIDPIRKVHRKKAGKNKVLLHVGRVTREKRIETIIDALSELPDDISLVVASDGPHMPALKRYAVAKKLKHRVVFTGYLSKDELYNLYSSANLFVMSSKTETQAIVLAEAASTGLPAVVIEAPVTADFVRKHDLGWVSSEKNLASTISEALSTGKKVFIPKDYTIGESTKKLLKLYQSLCEQR